MLRKQSGSGRIDFLDSMRGLAALEVFFSHFLHLHRTLEGMVTRSEPIDGVLKWLTYSPMHLFWSGGEAVLFFFVLSGFVLSLPFFEGRTVPIPAFVVRRFFRIYWPYLAVILASTLLLRLSLPFHPVEGLSRVWEPKWTHPADGAEYLRLLFMRGDFTNLDSPAWSLAYEMRISVFIPLICWIVRRTPPGWILGGAALLLSSAYWVREPHWTRVLPTFNYSLYFFMGCWVAKERRSLVALVSKMGNRGKVILLVLALNLYVLAWEFPSLYGPLSTPNPSIHLTDLFTGLAACSLIVLALSSGRIQAFLHQGPLLWLGRVSYSFYLVHVVALLSAIYFLPHSWGLWVRASVGGAASFLLAELSHRYVEVPSNAWGKRLAAKIG